MTEALTVTPEAAVAQAVARARAYAGEPLPDPERVRALRRAAGEVLARRAEIAQTLVEEVRKPVALARVEVDRTAEVIEWTASEWETLRGEVVPLHATDSGRGRLVVVRRDPVGIVCAITPFNFPVALTAHKLAPALAGGNACLVKPSEYAVRSVELLREAFVDAGFPPEAVAVVPGGPETVDALLADPEIGLYSFTGSPHVGRKVKADSGLRPVILELGANSATIVHADADLERAAASIARGAFAFAGQACFSVQRVLVHEDARDGLVAALLDQISLLRVGDPADEAVLVGPLVSEAAAERVEARIAAAVEAGATLLAGGGRDCDTIQPTLLEGVPQELELWCEEIFGPVAALRTYGSLDEAIALANDSRYGLQTGIFTAGVAVALEASERLRAGSVLVNESSSWRATPMPYGGIRDSGFGREGPRYALEAMTTQKVVALAE